MRLMHNMYSLSIYKNYKKELASNSKSIGNVSSGKKLNSSGDNPSKMAETDTLKMNIASRKAAKGGVQDVDSMLQTYDGALQELTNNVSRLKELVLQASGSTRSDSDLVVIQKEIDQVKSSINDLANKTAFNGIKLSQSTITTRKATIGELSGESIDIPYFNVTTKGLNIDDIDVTKSGSNNSYLNKIDAATIQVSSIRSKYGAIESRLEDSLNDYDEMDDTLTSAQSDIEDTDIATEMMNYSTSQILIKSGISLMAQSNQLPQDCVNLLKSSL